MSAAEGSMAASGSSTGSNSSYSTSMRSTASRGRLQRGGRHRGNLLAHETDDVIREYGHVPDTASDAPAPQLFPGDDGLDTLQMLGPGSYRFA